MEIFLLLVAGICTAALYFALTSSAEDGENVGKFDRNQSYEKSSMIDEGVISAAVQEFDNSPPTGELLDCSCSEIDYSQSRARESRSECIANDFYNCVEKIFSDFQVGWQALPLNPSDSDFFFFVFIVIFISVRHQASRCDNATERVLEARILAEKRLRRQHCATFADRTGNELKIIRIISQGRLIESVKRMKQ